MLSFQAFCTPTLPQKRVLARWLILNVLIAMRRSIVSRGVVENQTHTVQLVNSTVLAGFISPQTFFVTPKQFVIELRTTPVWSQPWSEYRLNGLDAGGPKSYIFFLPPFSFSFSILSFLIFFFGDLSFYHFPSTIVPLTSLPPFHSPLPPSLSP